MTNKHLDELDLGDFIADMHDGEAQLRERFEVVSHVRWDEPPQIHRTATIHGFYEYLQQFCRSAYTNKYLIVIGWADDSSLSAPVIIAGYCYDARRSGIITLRAKA